MFSVTGTRIKNNVYLTKFLADYVSDIENLPTSTSRGKQGEITDKENAVCYAGSECFVAEDSSTWVLNNQHEWVQKADSGGSSEDDEDVITAATSEAVLNLFGWSAETEETEEEGK